MQKSKMIKIVLIVAMMGCVFCMGAEVYGAEKTAYVVLGSLFDQYGKTQEADAKLSELAQQKQTERDAMVEAIRRMKDELVVFSDEGEEKMKKQTEIDNKIKELQSFDEETRTELRDIRDNNVKDIFEDLNAAIEEYGKKNKYDYIFTDRALVYKNEKLDITDAVLSDINKKYK
jgi:outer membrane protein